MKKRFIYFSLLIFDFSFMNAQSWLWGEAGIGDAIVWSIKSDASGNCYFTGIFPNDTLHFGGFTLPNPAPYGNEQDAFLVKYAPDGDVVWAKQTVVKATYNTSVTGSPYTISTDNIGNIYLNGNFCDSIIIGTDTLIANDQSIWSNATFLAKYDPNGDVIWAKKSVCGNDSSGIGGKGISSDKSGNTFVTGSFIDTILFSSDTITTPSPGIIYSFIVKYDSNGNVKWARQSTGTSGIYGSTSFGVASDNNGNSIITGFFGDSAIFGTIKLGSAVLPEFDGILFVVKYDSMGNVSWAKQANISNVYDGCVGVSVITDNVGNIYVCGNFVNTVTFGSYTLHGTNFGDIFIAKYDPNGNVIWVEQSIGLDSNTWNAWSISIDNAKHLYLSANGGYGRSKIAFGGDTLSMTDTTKYDGASVVFKLDSNGNALCSTIIPGGSHGGSSNAIASDTSGKHVYFGAGITTPVIFGNDTINPFEYPALFSFNFFPVAARWQACDTDIYSSVVQNNNSGMGVILYPNPSNGKAELGITNYELGMKYNLGVYDIFGRQIETLSITSKKTTIDLSNQPNGIYFYRVFNEKEIPIGQGKIIIEK